MVSFCKPFWLCSFLHSCSPGSVYCSRLEKEYVVSGLQTAVIYAPCARSKMKSSSVKFEGSSVLRFAMCAGWVILRLFSWQDSTAQLNLSLNPSRSSTVGLESNFVVLFSSSLMNSLLHV